jgi:hypothetical protein
MNKDSKSDDSRQRRCWRPRKPAIPEPGSLPWSRPDHCGPCHWHCVNSHLLRQVNHLPAPIAHAKMFQNLAALLLRQSLLGKSVKALCVGVKIELDGLVHHPAFSKNAFD